MGTNQEAPAKPRVLMVEGASYSSSFLIEFARRLAAGGRYELHCLSHPQRTGRDLGRSGPSPFRSVHYLPNPPAFPSGPADVARLAVRLAASKRPPPSLSGDSKGITATVARRLWWADLARRVRPLLGAFDLYHWHCFEPDLLPLLDWFPETARTIVTLWGSDLFRTAGIEEYRRQLTASDRASMFTMASIEMRETFMAKFGRSLQDKIRLIGYGADHLDDVERAKKDRSEFLRSLGISPETRIVTIGNCDNPLNQHLALLDEVESLPADLRSSVTVLVPMTYGDHTAHRAEVRQRLEQSGLRFHILGNFLPREDVARLWAATDVFLFTPISDQFSAALCECLVGGAVVITGAWLPYSRLRLNGAHYHEVSAIREVGAKLEFVLRSLDAENARCAGNVGILRRLMDWEGLVPQWEALYDEVLAQRR